ncbi:glucose-6-phosphate isomerase [Hazenella sp. IB182357]|uniref:Glucose-6-phosphate isomerase n=1 Tax=Polycladospora coralii TaxID=2771432 RepID=A0A926N9G4_9BACL|nr:glucose-6-phosphate isomerase [Polycladospora coralii]MBD1371365.1 glucose-6-phosphate isomerase [Polycladospora coralii]
MTTDIQFDYANAMLDAQELEQLEPQVLLAHQQLHQHTGAGANFLGWVDWPFNYDREEFHRVKQAAETIAQQANILVVIGVGGSYLGSRAVIEMLTNLFYAHLPTQKRKFPVVYYLGHHLSSNYMADLLELIEDHEVAINVVSKSGTTAEPALAFRVLRAYMEKRYGVEGARRRIYVTTDAEKGALKQLADEKKYETFTIPDDVGGRFSVLTTVGLLPIAVAGIDIEELMAGAQAGVNAYRNPAISRNICYQYAAIRNLLYKKGKNNELLVNYHPQMTFFCEWWKQLFGESEGKDQKGILPSSVNFTTDLHAMGQYIQEGRRHLFETVIFVNRSSKPVMIPEDQQNRDGMNQLAGKDYDFVNRKAYEGTLLAHVDGGVPNLAITLEQLTACAVGELIYFFEKACGLSGYLLGVNPFNQPGVEAYKKNMYALLGLPGYERLKGQLENRL